MENNVKITLTALAIIAITNAQAFASPRAEDIPLDDRVYYCQKISVGAEYLTLLQQDNFPTSTIWRLGREITLPDDIIQLIVDKPRAPTMTSRVNASLTVRKAITDLCFDIFVFPFE